MSMKDHMRYKEEQRKKHSVWLEAQIKEHEKNVMIIKNVSLAVVSLILLVTSIIIYKKFG